MKCGPSSASNTTVLATVLNALRDAISKSVISVLNVLVAYVCVFCTHFIFVFVSGVNLIAKEKKQKEEKALRAQAGLM